MNVINIQTFQKLREKERGREGTRDIVEVTLDNFGVFRRQRRNVRVQNIIIIIIKLVNDV